MIESINQFRTVLKDAKDGPLFLNSMNIPKEFRILVLAPHPDDFDAIGISMRHFRDNGNEIFLFVLSSGASGIEDNFLTLYPNQTKSEIRKSEQRESCRFFGLPKDRLAFLKLGEDLEGHIEDSDINRELIRGHLLPIHPDWVFLPHGNDTNSCHKRSFSILKKIAMKVDYSLTAFLNRDPKTITMKTHMYTLFSEEDAGWKRQLLRFHQSQHQRNLNTRNHGFDDRILKMNRKTALEELKVDGYAEAFEIIQFKLGLAQN